MIILAQVVAFWRSYVYCKAVSWWSCLHANRKFHPHMKTLPYPHLLAMVLAGALGSCANQSALVKVPVSTSPQHDTASSSHASQVFQAVNSLRRSKGLKEFQRHAGLDRLAQQHCEYLRQHRGKFSIYGKNVSHIGFEGRALVARERYHMENISENVAAARHAGTNPAAAVVGLWKGSKDHHKSMLDAWTHTGVGVVVDADGTVFADQLFATVSQMQRTTRARFMGF